MIVYMLDGLLSLLEIKFKDTMTIRRRLFACPSEIYLLTEQCGVKYHYVFITDR